MLKRPQIQLDTDRLMVPVLRLHQRLYEKSNGRIGARLGGVTCLLLRTTGRRSLAQRTVALAYARDGEDYILVASNNGSDSPPWWLENLRVHPEVELQVGTESLAGHATVVERSDPRYERLIRLANANNSWRYFHYQEKTTRPIPVVLVTPEAVVAH